MRADSFFFTAGTAGRLVLISLITVFLHGCKTDIDSEDPTIIGIPPENAYLGVEYSYNFGAVDNDDILKYSLSNSPSWLAMEDTTNKARQGIIIRGVPGISGGQRGRDDLGKTTRINIVGNDGSSLGAQPFSIDVQENQLSVVSQDYSEARPEQREEGEEEDEKPDFQCEEPFVGVRGEHTYPTHVYDESGNVIDTVNTTSETQPILVQISLDQPSVTTVSVAFDLTSTFDPTRCDEGFTPDHQRCDTGLANSRVANIGRDIVALGTGSGATLPIPDYLEYQQDDSGRFTKGVLTLEPGITECFVRLEVVDDAEPEKRESFTFSLTEVRSGIAGLGPSNAGVRESLRIEDNEPTVSFQTLNGGKRDVINLSPPAGTIVNGEEFFTTTEYKAVIDGYRDQTYFAKIGSQEGADAILDTDYFLELKNPDFPDSLPEWISGDELEFPVGKDEVLFRVRTASVDTYNNPAENDRVILLGPDTGYQAGRSNYVASDSDDPLRIGINELSSSLQVGSETDFIPTDMALGQNGRLLVAGYDSSAGNMPLLRVFNQQGDELPSLSLFPRSVSLKAPPVIAFGSREVEIAGEDTQRFELAVSFGVEEDETGNPTPGDVNLVTQRWFYDTALTPENFAQDWELINGTDQDDLTRWVGIDPTGGSVLVSGVTKGVIEPTDLPNGVFGSFIQRVDTKEDGADLEPEIAWRRKVESVSHDDRVVGGRASAASPIVIGDTSGSVEGEPQLGGKDAFFYTAQPVGKEIEVYQVGTSGDENLTDGFFGLSTVWLVGNNTSEYEVGTDGGVKVLRRSTLDSGAGFLLGYTFAGSPAEAYKVNDPDDSSSEVLLTAMVFDEDIIAAGSTTGSLTDDSGVSTNTLEDPALFRRNRQPRFVEDEDDNPDNDDSSEKTPIVELSQQWDQQLAVADPGTGRIEALANYRDDEINALVRVDDVWILRLFNAEGKLLNDGLIP